ncbi:MAG: cytidyltransferase [Opitutae bacterium]|nr:cytidyltransferase [Opitutae bacterium]|tara:strand:+ start:3436 stop:4104 length:669 start_codon:yes stop_codon:yes gene_type:complete
MKLAMIPARMGSQRLARKNLRELAGIPLVTRAVRKCLAAEVFDEVWLNSEHDAFAEIAEKEGVAFHKRPEALGSNEATSEEYLAEFLQSHPCEYVFQVHSIAPLLQTKEITSFVQAMMKGNADVMLSCEEVLIECALDGKPVNFSFAEKTNSQDLRPIQRISWSITGWRRSTYLSAIEENQCATYYGKVDFFTINPMASHIIKTEEDLRIAETLWPLIYSDK